MKFSSLLLNKKNIDANTIDKPTQFNSFIVFFSPSKLYNLNRNFFIWIIISKRGAK